MERRGVRPFLEWVAGKRQLLPVLRRFYPDEIGRDCYLQVRDERFNPMRAAWRDRGGDLDHYSPELDPPYAPLSATANFRGYTGRGFRPRTRSGCSAW